MGVKVAALCLASIASSLFAANQVAPLTSPDGRVKSAIVSLLVNRSLKGDRLPIRQLAPAIKVQERFKAPTIPDKKTETGCKPPVEIPGRCFA